MTQYPAPVAIPAPRSYIEWSNCLDLLEQGLDDSAALQAMENGTLEWTSGLAEMFSERVSATLNMKLKRCADQLSRQLSAGADEVTLVRALVNTRSTLADLKRLGELGPLPEILRTHLLGELKKYAVRTQSSLEDSAKTDRSGRLSSLVRNNSILGYEAQQVFAMPPSPSVQAAGMPTRRRNILT
ncbi:MAG: hypothetical protein ABW202_01840 [Duganella sp.]